MKENKFLCGILIHLGNNMWTDRHVGDPEASKMRYTPPPEVVAKLGDYMAKAKTVTGYTLDNLRFEEPFWHEITERMSKTGMNMCMIDLGEGIVFPSHPELAARGAWSPDKLRAELERLRGLGLEPIPKLNFSTTHDSWMGDYHKMVSTAPYYRAVEDLLRDAYELFDKPRYIHLGYDEEDSAHQWDYDTVVVRQRDLWWHDFLFTVKAVERLGARAWIWSDKIWHHRDEFVKRMPKTVLQSNWYYQDGFDTVKPDNGEYPMIHAYDWLEEAGYDQVPCCSSCGGWRMNKFNGALMTVDYCRDKAKIAPSRMKGLLTAPWCPTMEFARLCFDQTFETMAPAQKALHAWLGV